ncbi:MAG: protein kinase [Gemmatimonadales bacterium]|jgi:serine/threonine-protein kinase
MTDVLDRLGKALADRYTIEREIGSGGMATVYLAEDLKHHRKVAIKVLRADLAATLGPERFLREIEVAAQLQHPHVLPLHDSGEADGFLYYVMPFVDGQSLRDKLAKEGELPIGEAVRILRDVVDALTAAHQHGVVHRDIKPENILLSGRHALVTDFGVAKAVSEATGREQLTTAGVALGTPAYMAPEQAAADPHLDHRVDLYAVGAVAYELLTGRPVFMGTTPQMVLSAHVTEAPQPVTKHRDTVPVALESVVMRCLEKKPADRFQSAEELLPQLEALATPSGGVTPTDTVPVRASPRAKRTPFLAASAVAVVLAAIVAVMLLPRGADPTLDPDRIVVGTLRNATGDPALDQLGEAAGHWITQGLQQTGLLKVVPWETALQSSRYVQAEADRSSVRDPVRALAEEVAAGIVVSGAFYRDADSLRFQVEITNAARGTLVDALDPIRGDAAAPMAVVERLRERVLGSLAINLDDRIAPFVTSEAPPPTWEASQSFQRGLELYYANDWSGATDEFIRAAELDSTFLTPLVYAVYAASNSSQTAALSDSLTAVLYGRRDDLLPLEAHVVEASWLADRGDYAARLRAFERAAALAPGSKWTYNYARALTQGNRPRQAIEILTTQLEPEKGPMRGWYSYGDELAAAYDAVGDHDRALETVLQTRALYPSNIGLVGRQMQALAGLGHVEEVIALLDTVAAMETGYAGSPGAVMVNAARWLAAYGHDGGARRVAERAIEWYSAEYPADSGGLGLINLSVLDAHAIVGRLEAPRNACARFIQEYPDFAYLHYCLGLTAAYMRDLEEAMRESEWLAAHEGWTERTRALRRARIAEALGDREEAVYLLRIYFTDYGYQNRNLYVPSLRDYPQFQELMRPKG